MARAIIGVIVGYIVLAAVLFTGLTAAWFAMGDDRAFQPGVYLPSTMWLVVMFGVGVVGALLAGLVCAAFTGRTKPVMVLAVITALIGVGEGAYYLAKPRRDPGPRTGKVTMMDAMKNAQTPPWVYFGNAGVALVCIPLGGRLKKTTAAA